jgi:hypothetical protein
MKKRLFVFSLMLCLVIIMTVVEVGNANPFFIFHEIDPIAGTIPPNVVILSPQNNQTSYTDRVVISFNVTRPFLGNNDTAIIDVKYILDGETTQAFSIWHGGSASNANAVPEFDTTFTSPLLTRGHHQLSVVAEGVVYTGNLSIFFITGSSTISFTMGNQTTELTPMPSQISTPDSTTHPESTVAPSITPMLTPTQIKESNFPSNAIIFISIVSVFVIVTVASALLFHFKRRKSKVT